MYNSAITVAQKHLAVIEADAFGGQLMQVQLAQKDIFYQAPCNLYLQGSPRRGGVPVLFPQFATYGNFAKHGFARHMPWHAGEKSVGGGESEGNGEGWQAILAATSVAVAPYLPTGTQDWPHDAELQIMVMRDPEVMTITLSVTNIGSSPFSFTGGLHPYFLWSDGDCVVGGADNKVHQVLTKNIGTGRTVEELLGNEQYMYLSMSDRKLTLRKFGFHEWMLWNPGPGHSLTDIEPDDWQRFVCLEPISVSQPHYLAPGEVFVGGFELSLSSA